MLRRRLTRPLTFLAAMALVSGTTRSWAQGQVEPPVVLTHVDAIYPPSAVASGKHVDVVLAVTVDVHGDVSAVEVLESGGPDLDQAAETAVHQWKFRPAARDGKPVAARIRVPFHFAPPTPPAEIQPAPSPEPVIPGNVVPAQPQSGAPVTTGPSPASVGTAEEQGVHEEPSATEVNVRGRAEPPSHGISEHRFERGELGRVPVRNATEVARQAMPSLMITNEGGEGHADQIFLRGFDAREGQDVEFSVGGVPINESGNLHGNGYADTHFIIPELVTELRVAEGPFDPRQGNYAVAGSADYQLGLEKRGLTAQYTTGSFDTQRMLLLWGPKGESEHTFAGAEIYSTDGYGQNRDAKRASAMSQYEGQLGEHGSYRITAQAYSTHYHAAGLIREDDYASGKIGFYDSYDLSSYAREQVPQGGDSSRYSLAGDVETKAGDTTFGQQIFFIKRDMRLLENFTGFLLDVQEPLQTLHPQRGDELDLNVHETTVGARGFARLQGKALDQKQSIEFGYFARGDDSANTQDRLEANTGVPYLTDNDYDAKLGDIGLYGDADLKATRWLAFRGGARADLFTFDVLDNCASHTVAHPSTTNPPVDQSCLTQQDLGRPRLPNQQTSTSSVAALPKASVLVGPFEGFLLSASYGQGVRSVDPTYITQDVGTPFASIVAYEGGAQYTHPIGDTDFSVRSVFFDTHVDKDLIFNETAGRNVLGAGTTRTGWVGATRLRSGFFDESASLTLVRSSYDDTHLLVAYVPGVVFRSDTAVFSNLPLKIDHTPVAGTASAGITYVGPRALPYGQTSGDIFTVDVAGTLAWRAFEVGILCTNLFNNMYRLGEYNFASDFHSQPQPTLVPERMFSAGPPRSIFGTFAVTFGGV